MATRRATKVVLAAALLAGLFCACSQGALTIGRDVSPNADSGVTGPLPTGDANPPTPPPPPPPCGATSCPAAETCCDTAAAGSTTCIPGCVSGPCPQVACSPPPGPVCGDKVCAPGQSCCDLPGTTTLCTPQCVTGPCPVMSCKVPPPGITCGSMTCTTGQTCCSGVGPSCMPMCVSGNVCPVSPCASAEGGVAEAGTAYVVCGTGVCPSGDICCSGVPFTMPTCVSATICPL